MFPIFVKHLGRFLKGKYQIIFDCWWTIFFVSGHFWRIPKEVIFLEQRGSKCSPDPASLVLPANL